MLASQTAAESQEEESRACVQIQSNQILFSFVIELLYLNSIDFQNAEHFSFPLSFSTLQRHCTAQVVTCKALLPTCADVCI